MTSPASSLPSGALAEIQGLYGAFSFPEKLLQKIWLRGDFDRSDCHTAEGRRVKILHPGKWNLLGGPDFHGARLRFDDGPEITGDVEVHLRIADWNAHDHARDPAYNKVVLHVVLFPPAPGAYTQGAQGRIPVLSLLTLLHHDLEEFAAEEAVEVLAHRVAARLPDELGELTPEELTRLFARHAEARWRQKVHFARLRRQRLGWGAACHHVALEVLGYRFNRAPMLRVAGAWPLPVWTGEQPVQAYSTPANHSGPSAQLSHALDTEAIFASESGNWSLQGVRPANQPRTRLNQYRDWTRLRPDWPQRLQSLAITLPQPSLETETREVRRKHSLAAVRARLGEEVCAGALGGTRFDNLVCDGLLPLLAAETGRDLRGLWHHWFPGDLPPLLTTGLRQLGIFDGKAQPACHGIAQGLLGWLIEREARR